MEVLRRPSARFRAVLFDFDGTLSLVRGGWVGVMARQMADHLGDALPPDEIHALILRLNGKPTIHQMRALSAAAREHGRPFREPEEYLAEFHQRLGAVIAARRTLPPERLRVPGSLAFVADLQRRGLALALASGTDHAAVTAEADWLGFAPFFPHIDAPVNDDPQFSKAAVIARLLKENGWRGEEMLAFGDGIVEIEEIKKVGGWAVAVASDEEQPGQLDADKRRRLLAAGADAVIADYTNAEPLTSYLFGTTP